MPWLRQVSSRSPIVFLCGGANSARRDDLALYLRKRTNALVFYAEHVWSAVQHQKAADALQMEGRLAELADMVVVIVESAGTLAELGAFSLHPALLKKLLPIIDSQYKGAESFVSTGPIRSVDGESIFAPTLYTKFQDSFLLCADEVERRLGAITDLSYALTEEQVANDSRHFLVFLVALVTLLHPVTERHLAYYVNALFGTRQRLRVGELLVLAVSLGLLHGEDLAIAPKQTAIFYAPKGHRRLLTTERFDHARARARVYGVLQRIPAAMSIIEHFERSARVSS